MRRNRNKNIWRIKRRDKKRAAKQVEKQEQLKIKREQEEIAKKLAQAKANERKQRGFRLFVKKGEVPRAKVEEEEKIKKDNHNVIHSIVHEDILF